jgi:hypothetical protein
MTYTRQLIRAWAIERAPTSTEAALDDLSERIDEWIEGIGATYQIQAQILQEEIDTLRGVPQPYRVIERATGRVLDFATAERVMDHLFAIGGIAGLTRFWVYKDSRRITMPHGGEAGAIARWLDAA